MHDRRREEDPRRVAAVSPFLARVPGCEEKVEDFEIPGNGDHDGGIA